MAHEVSLTTIQKTIARALASGSYDRKRVERAAQLVILGAVTKIDEHTYRVASQTADDTFYRVTPDGCGCMDALRRPSDRCKHDIAVRILLSAQIQEQKAREAAVPVVADQIRQIAVRAVAMMAEQYPHLTLAEIDRLQSFKRQYRAEATVA